MGSAFTIFPAPAGHPWQLARVDASECALSVVQGVNGFDGPFTTVAEALRQLGYRGEGAMLALPSGNCLCAGVSDHGLKTIAREKPLLFRLEEQLPLALEDVVTDFIPCDGGAFGVAVPVDTIKSLIETLEAQRIAITNICPAALLIADGVSRSCQDQTHRQVLLSSLHGKIDLIGMRNELILWWSVLEPSVAALRLVLRYHTFNQSEPTKICATGLSPDLQSQIGSEAGLEFNQLQCQDPLEVAARASRDILAGNRQPPVELRRGALASPDPLRQLRRPLRFSLAMLVLLSSSLAFSMLWRAWQYDRLADEAQNRQLATFHEALPHQSPPLLITRRLLSEQKRLEGLDHDSGIASPSLSALPLLEDVLRGLPQDVRIRLLELRFEPDQFYLNGQSLDHTSADRIAQSLRESTGLAVDPPHTEILSGSDVTFEISAEASNSNLQGAER
jgi:hypothetical protein